MASNHESGWLQKIGIGFVVLVIGLGTCMAFVSPVHAQQSDENEFDIQVTPAILPITLKPGVTKKVTLGVRNLSNHPETLTPRLSGFTIDKQSQKVELNNT